MKVVHCNKHDYDVYIGRPSKWGNPFTHIKEKDTLAEFVVSSRDEAINKYMEWILANETLLSQLDELGGKILGCWCVKNENEFPIPYVCHGQVLIELINKNKLKKLLNK